MKLTMLFVIADGLYFDISAEITCQKHISGAMYSIFIEYNNCI
jgi:hypothetical protein